MAIATSAFSGRDRPEATKVCRRALAAAVLSGSVMAVQLHLNGLLGDRLGSVLGVALISLLSAMGIAAVAVLVRPKARVGLRMVRQIPFWRGLGGLGGAAMVAVGAAAAPRLGVALLTVGIVAGQTAGAILVDRAGLGPSGRHLLTVPRIGGAMISFGAVAISILGRSAEHPSVLLFTLVIATGGLASVQQALNGWVGRELRDASVAALLNFAVGTAAIALVLAGGGALPRIWTWNWPPIAQWYLYLGGPLGVLVVGVAAVAVRTLGVLRLGLSVVAGQLLGGLVLDFLAPTPDSVITISTVLGASLTLVAVGLTGLRLK